MAAAITAVLHTTARDTHDAHIYILPIDLLFSKLMYRHHGQPPGKIKPVVDHFAKSPTKSKDFGKIYFPQTRISLLGITLFILFDPKTPLPM